MHVRWIGIQNLLFVIISLYFHIHVVITPEVVPIFELPAVGYNYSLVCRLTGIDSLNPTIMYQWFKVSPGQTQVGTNSPTLTFDPLVLSDAAQYICEVTVSVSNYTSQFISISSNNYEIRFPSKHKPKRS